jgi:ArsR family transcriptional regulator
MLTPLALFKILSDETRLMIVLLLREKSTLCVCELCEALQVIQPKISRHLAILRNAGLLLDRRQGKWIHYQLSPHIPAWSAVVIEQAWLSQRQILNTLTDRLGDDRSCS